MFRSILVLDQISSFNILLRDFLQPILWVLSQFFKQRALFDPKLHPGQPISISVKSINNHLVLLVNCFAQTVRLSSFVGSFLNEFALLDIPRWAVAILSQKLSACTHPFVNQRMLCPSLHNIEISINKLGISPHNLNCHWLDPLVQLVQLGLAINWLLKDGVELFDQSNLPLLCIDHAPVFFCLL